MPATAPGPPRALAAWLERVWYGRASGGLVLVPLSWLFRLAVWLRGAAYARGWARCVTLPVPVVVVGNITVGGTGKTPLVVHLVELMRAAGWRPGVVSRGYGGSGASHPRRVRPDSDPDEVGDEPLLVARRARCPVVVGADRVAAARLLVDEGVDLVLSDDGLQHYRLGRDVEVVVLDGARMLGNGHCLPAGPLRESASRLQRVDVVVVNGAGHFANALRMRLLPDAAVRLHDGERRALSSFRGARVHAVAGVGNPRRFFTMLRERGLDPIEHRYRDHARYHPQTLSFDDGLPVLMTEKDAVKCRRFGDLSHWYVPVRIEFDGDGESRLLNVLSDRLAQRAAG